MRLLLEAVKSMNLSRAEVPVVSGLTRLKVLYCGICRTDAKMWDQGHRDLILPRVPGHEIAAMDEATGEIYTVWPGQACGKCEYCESDRENLCREMQIIGFHADGGFARFVYAPEQSMIPSVKGLPSHLLCFAEPIGCLCNGLDRVDVSKDETVLIIGGGILGLLAALVCKHLGAIPLVVEHSAEKIIKSTAFVRQTGIKITRELSKEKFDVALNCCDSPQAFTTCVAALKKTGRLCCFSALQKNSRLDSSIINQIHYKELVLSGSYGPKRRDMVTAVSLCNDLQQVLPFLIEEIITLTEAESRMADIYGGKMMKVIIDLENDRNIL